MGKSPGDTACYAVIIFCTILYSATGITLTPCGPDNTVEILDIRGDTTVTCSEIPEDFIVDWSLSLPSRPTAVDVGSCNVGSTTCSDFSGIGYLATRPFSNTSLMYINPTKSVNFVRNGTLECKASKAGNPNQVKSCHLDIISSPSSVKCTVKSDTSASSVIGHCDITRIYSYNSRYNCQWYSTEGSAAERKVTAPVDVQTKIRTADFTPTGGQYVDVVFNITMTRKLTVDTLYSVVFWPGGVTQDAGKTDATIIIITVLAVGVIVGIVVGCCCGAIVLPCVGYASYVGVCWIISKKYRNGSQAVGQHSSQAEQRPQSGQPPQGGQPPGGHPPLGRHPSPGEPPPPLVNSPPVGPPPGWHVHYLCGKRIEYVYFCCLRNGCTVLILSRSPKTNRFRFFGTEDGLSGPRKVKNVKAPRELTTVRTSSPPQAVTFHDKNHPSAIPHAGNQSAVTPHLRPLPEPRMPSVERNSAVEISKMLLPGKQSEPLPPIGKQSKTVLKDPTGIISG